MQVERLSARAWCVRDLGGDVNVGFVATGSGAVVFDTGRCREDGERLAALVGETTGEAVSYVVNSHLHGRHCGGNVAFDGTFLFSRTALDALARDERQALRRRHRNQIVFSRDAMLKLGEVLVELRLVEGHAPGSLVMNVISEGVVFAGDLLVVGRNPAATSSDLVRWAQELRWLEELPATSLLPGHGALGSREDCRSLRRYLEGLLSASSRLKRAGLRPEDLLARGEPAPLDPDPACPNHRRNIERAFRQVA